MDIKDKKIIEEFKKRVSSDTLTHLKRIIIYGSKARGDATEDSDLDVVVLVDNKTPELEKTLEDTAYQVMYDNDFKPVISLKVFAESSYKLALGKGFSFYKMVEKEGIYL